MKNKLKPILQFALLVLASCLYGQSSIVCAPSNNVTYTVQTTSQLSECNELRQLFVPTPVDCVLTVQLNFFVFAPTNTASPGTWGTSTQTDAESIITYLNNKYANLQPPHLYAGAPFIPDSKIRFKLKHFYLVHDDYYYAHANNPSFLANNGIGDCDAINICYVAVTNTVNIHTDALGNITSIDTSFALSGGHDYYLPGKYIFYAANGLYMGIPRVISNYNDVDALAHELGHSLGLNHPSVHEKYAFVKPPMGMQGCCEMILANDVELETFTLPFGAPGDVYGATGPCTTLTVNYSNNIMANNADCKTYLSPFQLAVMHHNLRTNMKDVLTPASYTNAMYANHAFDTTITTNTIWWADKYFKGNVTIHSGISLTIYCTVSMLQYASFIIEPGAQLVIGGSGKITNINGHLWGGIEVGGSPTHDQSLNMYGHGNYQGTLRVLPGGIISHAENAVKNYRTTSIGTVDWNTIGGIIIANGANFLDNSRDVEFLAYTHSPSISEFNLCNFKTDGPIGQTLNGGQAQPLTHVSLWGIDGVKFRNCNFEYAADSLFSDPGVGIFSCDASYSVDKNGGSSAPSTIFKKLSHGVYALNANPLKTVSVNRSVFTDNTVDAVYLHNVNNAVFDKNTIKTKLSNGLYLSNCSGYTIKNNSFEEGTYTQAGTGIYAYNSFAGSHQIYRNTFSNLSNGIGAIGNNGSMNVNTTGLKMNCNDFSITANDYDIAMFVGFYNSIVTLPLVMVNQGKPSIPYSSPTEAVRNIYGASSGCGTCENQWYIEGTSAKHIKHPVTTATNNQPTPQPDYSDVDVNMIYTGLSFNYSIHCSLNALNSGGNPTSDSIPTPSQRLTNTYTYLSTLQSAPEEERDDFEIQATLGTQLNLFLTDSVLQNKDSVIALLVNHAADIANADLLTVYAYMNKGDLVTAQAKTDSLPAAREAWKPLLSKQIAFQADPASLYHLSDSAGTLSFLEGYMTYDTLDGFAPARALLQFFGGQSYTDQRPVPVGSGGARLLQQQAATQANKNMLNALRSGISAYPNPASETLNVSYQTTDGKSLQVILTDALGRKVYENTLRPASVLEISMAGLNNGVYILNAYDNKTSVYQNKVICIK